MGILFCQYDGRILFLFFWPTRTGLPCTATAASFQELKWDEDDDEEKRPGLSYEDFVCLFGTDAIEKAQDGIVHGVVKSPLAPAASPVKGKHPASSPHKRFSLASVLRKNSALTEASGDGGGSTYRDYEEITHGALLPDTEELQLRLNALDGFGPY